MIYDTTIYDTSNHHHHELTIENNHKNTTNVKQLITRGRIKLSISSQISSSKHLSHWLS